MIWQAISLNRYKTIEIIRLFGDIGMLLRFWPVFHSKRRYFFEVSTRCAGNGDTKLFRVVSFSKKRHLEGVSDLFNLLQIRSSMCIFILSDICLLLLFELTILIYDNINTKYLCDYQMKSTDILLLSCRSKIVGLLSWETWSMGIIFLQVNQFCFNLGIEISLFLLISIKNKL